MFSELTLNQLVSAGGWLGVIVLAILAMMRGWLIPLKTVKALEDVYKAIIEDKDKQIDQWRKAYNAQSERADQLTESQSTILDAVRTNNIVLQEFIEKTRKARPDP